MTFKQPNQTNKHAFMKGGANGRRPLQGSVLVNVRPNRVAFSRRFQVDADSVIGLFAHDIDLERQVCLCNIV